MAQKLILHIGHAKTGTTMLQKTLQASRSVLAERGILYPDTGRHWNHKVLIPALLCPRGEPPTGVDIAASREAWGSVLQQLEHLDPHTVILSSEQLFRSWGPSEADAMRSNLNLLASEVDVCVYLRDPAALAVSLIQQNVKGQTPRKFWDPNFSYRAKLEFYDSLGLGTVQAKVFDRKNLRQGNIVHDFCAEHLPDANISDLTQLSDANTSMSSEAMSLLHEIQKGDRIFRIGKPRREIPRTDQKLEGFTRPRAHDQIRAALQASFKDRDWLHAHYNLTFPDIDTSGMSFSEAEKIINDLNRIEDICHVDQKRKAALWASLTRLDAVLYRLFKPA